MKNKRDEDITELEHLPRIRGDLDSVISRVRKKGKGGRKGSFLAYSWKTAVEGSKTTPLSCPLTCILAP